MNVILSFILSNGLARTAENQTPLNYLQWQNYSLRQCLYFKICLACKHHKPSEAHTATMGYFSILTKNVHLKGMIGNDLELSLQLLAGYNLLIGHCKMYGRRFARDSKEWKDNSYDYMIRTTDSLLMHWRHPLLFSIYLETMPELH